MHITHTFMHITHTFMLITHTFIRVSLCVGQDRAWHYNMHKHECTEKALYTSRRVLSYKFERLGLMPTTKSQRVIAHRLRSA